MKHRGGIYPLATLALSAAIIAILLGLAAGAAAEEARCAWFTRFEWSTRQDIIDEMANLDACHINAVLFQIRGSADAFYISEYEPWSYLIGDAYPGYDPLAVAIYEAHKRGMELHAYVNAMPAWGSSSPPVSPDHIYNAHPEWIMVDENGDPMEYPFTYGYAFVSPGIPQAREHINNVIMDIATNYDVDGIHLDYIRYPYPTYSYDDSSLARFARDYPGCTPDSCQGEWNEFRRALITEVVETAYDSVTALKDWVKMSAAVWGVFAYGYNDYYQDSHGWLDDGVIDFTAPMIYTANPSTFQSRLHDHAINKYGRHVYAGIGVYYSGMTPAIMVAEVDTCRSEGVEGQTMFSASDLYGSYQTALIGSGGPYEIPDIMPDMAWKSARPFIASVALPISGDHVDVLFNRDVDPTTGQNVSSYSFGSSLAATGAVRDGSDHRLIHLTTTPQHPDSIYVLTVNNVQDEGGKETVAWPNNRRKFYGMSGSGIEIIVDDEDGAPAFTTIGSWSTSTYGDVYNTLKHYHSKDSNAYATWMTPIPVPGYYDLYFWVNDNAYAEDATYFIETAYGTRDTVGNQYWTGDGWGADGSHRLGTFPFSDTARVTVWGYWDLLGTYVVADAIRLIYVSPLQPDAPPAAVADLASFKSAADIVLSWTAVDRDTSGNPMSVDGYVIYRNTDPAAELADSIGSVTGTDYTDAGAAGSAGTNYYYVIKAVSNLKGKSAASNRVGEFDILLKSAKKATAAEVRPTAR